MFEDYEDNDPTCPLCGRPVDYTINGEPVICPECEAEEQ